MVGQVTHTSTTLESVDDQEYQLLLDIGARLVTRNLD